MGKELSLDILDKQVRKSNALIQKARFSLSTQQQKILLYLISQIQPWDKEFQTYKFSIREFAAVCGLDYPKGGKDYTEIKEQIKRIADKSMWLLLEDGNTETLVRWIENPVIQRNSGTIELKLNEALKPYLLQLKERYTQYQLVYTLNFKSKYSIRLYEVICSIHFHELEEYNRIFSIEQLKKMLDCESYNDFRNFKRVVLDKAIKEINSYSDKDVTYKTIKDGRKVVGVELTIKSKNVVDSIKVGAKIEKKLGIT